MKKNSSRAIALAGIGSALSLIFVVMAKFLSFGSTALNVAASLAMMMPLICGYWKVGILSYLVVSGLSMIVLGPIAPLQFILFYGSYALVMYLLDFKLAKVKLKKPLLYTIIAIIKLAYFNLALFLIIKLMSVVVSDINILGFSNWSYWLLCIIGMIVFLAYDFLLRWVFKNMCALYNRVVLRGRVQRDVSTDDDIIDDSDIDTKKVRMKKYKDKSTKNGQNADDKKPLEGDTKNSDSDFDL